MGQARRFSVFSFLMALKSSDYLQVPYGRVAQLNDLWTAIRGATREVIEEKNLQFVT